MRIVLDTNVFVSALLSGRGAPAGLLDRWNDDEYELITGDAQLDELERVLAYPKIARYLATGVAEILLGRLRQAAIDGRLPLPEVDLSPDPDDNAILAIAIAGRADLLASGDRKHLLPLGEAEGVLIVSPADAMERLSRR